MSETANPVLQVGRLVSVTNIVNGAHVVGTIVFVESLGLVIDLQGQNVFYPWTAILQVASATPRT